MVFGSPEQSALQARYAAQRIAFGPIVFQCVSIAWKWGLLELISQSGRNGIGIMEIGQRLDASPYAIDVLLQSCLSAGVVSRSQDGLYTLEKVGHCLLLDKLTQTNMNFVRDVCYLAMHEFEESLRSEQPRGLAVLGDWPTIYDGLATMPEPARSSWLQFNQYYSDNAFPMVLDFIFETCPRRIMDIGANTGKWAIQCLEHDAQVEMVLVDLPGQLAVAREVIDQRGFGARAVTVPMDVLDPSRTLPTGIDVLWMSQFLACFGEQEVVSILSKAADCLTTEGYLYVLDTFWDRQTEEIAAYCLLNISAYFTAIAKGNSKIYSYSELTELAEQSGFTVEKNWGGIGYCHTLIRLRKKRQCMRVRAGITSPIPQL